MTPLNSSCSDTAVHSKAIISFTLSKIWQLMFIEKAGERDRLCCKQQHGTVTVWHFWICRSWRKSDAFLLQPSSCHDTGEENGNQDGQEQLSSFPDTGKEDREQDEQVVAAVAEERSSAKENQAAGGRHCSEEGWWYVYCTHPLMAC